MNHEHSLFTQKIEGAGNLPQASDTLAYLKKLTGSLPLFQQLQSDDFLGELEPCNKHFQGFEHVVILGTGGSSLGGQTLLALPRDIAKYPQFHFLDNIDPYTFHTLFPKINLAKTGIIAISKSGNTAETLMQLLFCLQYWQDQRLPFPLKDHFLVVSEPQENGIRRLAATYNLPCLDHPADIGGRFAVFTVVGMLPALIAGLNVQAIRAGARLVLDSLSSANCLPLQGALAHQKLAHSGITQTVLMPYSDSLLPFSFWFRQLWAESLGKGKQGITPLQALGTVDQHSQLQLYLDGPRDKFFTIVTLSHGCDKLKISLPAVGHPAVDQFRHKNMEDLMRAEQQATIDTLHRHHCPTRVIHLGTLDETSLGGLMMHYMLETLAMAHLMNVNPFDQPAVEESKILTRRYLRA